MSSYEKMSAFPSLPAIAASLSMTLALFAAPSGYAEVLLDEDFATVALSGSGSNQILTTGNGTVFRALHSTDPDGLNLPSVSPGEFFNGSSAGYLRYSPRNNYNSFVQFTPVTLSAVGDYVTFAFDVRYPDGATDGNAAAIKYSLYDSIDGQANDRGLSTLGGANPIGDTAKGYMANFNPAEGDLAWSNGSISMSEDPGDGSRTSYNGVMTGTQGLGSWSRAGGDVFDSDWRTVSLTIALTATGVDILTDIDGITAQASDTTPPTTRFDTFYFGTSASAGSWDMTNVLVTTNVPEPGSIGLLTLGALAIGARRRQRRAQA